MSDLNDILGSISVVPNIKNGMLKAPLIKRSKTKEKVDNLFDCQKQKYRRTRRETQ